MTTLLKTLLVTCVNRVCLKYVKEYLTVLYNISGAHCPWTVLLYEKSIIELISSAIKTLLKHRVVTEFEKDTCLNTIPFL